MKFFSSNWRLADTLRGLARADFIPAHALEYGLEVLGVVPNASRWRVLLRGTLLALAAAFCAASGLVAAGLVGGGSFLDVRTLAASMWLVLTVFVARTMLQPGAINSGDALLMRLEEDGFDVPDVWPYEEGEQEPIFAPLAERVLGWALAVGLVGAFYVLLAFRIGDGWTAAIFAPVGLITGVLLERFGHHKPWVRHLGTGLVVAGLLDAGLVAFVLLHQSLVMALSSIALLAVVIFALVRGTCLRFLAMFAAIVAVLLTARHLGFGYVVTALVTLMCLTIWQNEASWSTRHLARYFYPAGYAAAFALLIDVACGFGDSGRFWFPADPWALDSVVLGCALLTNTAIIVRRCGIPKRSIGSWGPLLVALTVALVCWRMPGITAAIFILFLGFRRGRYALIFSALTALVGYGFAYAELTNLASLHWVIVFAGCATIFYLARGMLGRLWVS